MNVFVLIGAVSMPTSPSMDVSTPHRCIKAEVIWLCICDHE